MALRDGASDQFYPISYPSPTIFCPYISSFIYGTPKMALISIFLPYLCPLPTISPPCPIYSITNKIETHFYRLNNL